MSEPWLIITWNSSTCQPFLCCELFHISYCVILSSFSVFVGNPAEEDSKIEAGIAKEPGIPPAAAKDLKELSDIAHQIGVNLQKGDFEAIIKLWQRATDIIKGLPAKLTNKRQQLVVKFLMTPWVEKHLQLLKQNKGSKRQTNVYYREKNAILEALKKIAAEGLNV